MAAKTETTKTSATVPVKRGKREPEKPQLTHWHPWRLFDELRDEMEELWCGARDWPAFPHLPRPVGREAATFMPSADVYRTNGNLVVKADLPGLKKHNVDVRVEDGFLVVRGERREEKEEKDKEYYRSECSYGSFYRRVPLPDGVDADKISAKVHDGVLTVTVPLPAVEAKDTKKIAVT